MSSSYGGDVRDPEFSEPLHARASTVYPTRRILSYKPNTTHFHDQRIKLMIVYSKTLDAQTLGSSSGE